MSYNSDEIAIRVNNVTKAYKIFDAPVKRFLFHMFRTKTGRDFVALDNVSFEVKKGESFGIIGRNGSGKSTMLQILAGIIKATSGEVCVNGRVAALLELGSGFDMESTGYENIYMNAAILGVTKSEIDKKLDEIITFADIGDFINQPVKTYSSGMFIRLAFSVAINVDADILLIDEALAVGDVFFRQKCYKKLDQLKEQGKTIILVSHGMNEVEQFCDRVLLLNKSKTLMCGASREAVQKYYMLEQEMLQEENHVVEPEKQHNDTTVTTKQEFTKWEKSKNAIWNCNIEQTNQINNGKARFLNVGIFDKYGNASKVFHQGEEAYFLYEIEALENIFVPIMGIVFYDQKNTIIFGKDNMQAATEVPDVVKRGEVVKGLFRIKMDIAVGEYTFDAGFNTMDTESYNKRMFFNQDEINGVLQRLCCLPNVGSFAIHERKIGEPMKIMFHGCCDLSSEAEIVVEKRI